MAKKTKFKLTEKGIIKKKIYLNHNHICRTWEDIYENYGYDTEEKRIKLKKNFKNKIKQVEYKTGTSSKNNKAMVISPEYTDECSELQKIGFSNEEIIVLSNNAKNKAVKSVSSGKILYKKVMKELDAMLEYIFEGRIISLEGDILDLSSGEIIKSKKSIYSLVNRNTVNMSESQIKYVDRLTEEDLAFTLLIECKNKVEENLFVLVNQKNDGLEKVVVFKNKEEIMENIKKERLAVIEQNNKLVFETEEEKNRKKYVKAIETVKNLNLLLDLSKEMSDNELRKNVFKTSGVRVCKQTMFYVKDIIKQDFSAGGKNI